jgi:hypothetical protein
MMSLIVVGLAACRGTDGRHKIRIPSEYLFNTLEVVVVRTIKTQNIKHQTSKYPSHPDR